MVQAATAFALLAGLASAGPLMTQPAELWTEAKIKAMTPAAVSQQLLGDFGRGLVLDESADKYRISKRLRQLVFLGRPRWTYAPGLCEIQRVEVSFEADSPSDHSGHDDIPVRPTAVKSSPTYAILDIDQARRGRPTSAAERINQQAACERLDPLAVHRTRASLGWEVSVALRFTKSLVDQARAGQITGTLDCAPMARSGWRAITEAECIDVLGTLQPEEIDSVRQCRKPSSDCQEVSIDGYHISASFDPQGNPTEVSVDRVPPPPPLH